MSKIVLRTDRNEKVWLQNLIPARSKKVEAAWLKAEELSQEKKCCPSRLLIAASIAKAVALSFFNVFSYLGLAVYHLLTKNLVHCKGNEFLTDLDDAANSLTFSIIGAAVVTASFFFPKTVFSPELSSKLKLMEGDVQKEAAPEKIAEDTVPSVSSKDAKDAKEDGIEIKKNETKEDKQSFDTSFYDDNFLFKFKNDRLESKKASDLESTQFESLQTLEQTEKAEEPKTQVRAAKGTENLCSFTESFMQSFPEGSSSVDKPSEKQTGPESLIAEKENINDESGKRVFSVDDINPISTDENFTIVDHEPETEIFDNESRSLSPVSENNAVQISPPHSASSSSLIDHLARQLELDPGSIKMGESLPFSRPQKDIVKAPREQALSLSSAAASGRELVPFNSQQLPANAWKTIAGFLKPNDRSLLLNMLRRGGFQPKVIDSMRPYLLKAHYEQEGIDLRILKETVVGDETHYEVKLVICNMKSENVQKPTRDDTNKRMDALLQKVNSEFRLLKEKGLILKNSRLIVKTVDVSYSDISLRATFNREILPRIEELDVSSTRITVEAFNNIYQLSSLKTFLMDFCHGENVRLDRYKKRTPSHHEPFRRRRFARAVNPPPATLPQRPKSAAEKAKEREEDDRLVITEIRTSTPCKSVERVSMIGTSVHGNFFQAITTLFPKAQQIDYSPKPSQEVSSDNGMLLIKDRLLDCGHLATKAEAEKAVQTSCCPDCSSKVKTCKEIQPIVRATRNKHAWDFANVVENGAMVHTNCGMLFNPSSIEKMFDMGEKAKAHRAHKANVSAQAAAKGKQSEVQEFNPFEEVVKHKYLCHHCGDPFTKENMKPVKK